MIILSCQFLIFHQKVILFQDDNDVVEPTCPDCNMVQNNEMRDSRPLYDDYASQSEDEEEVFHGIVQVKEENISEVDPSCQEEMKWYDCHDLLAKFLQPSQKVVFLLFMKTEFGFTFYFKLQLQYQVFVWYKHSQEARVLDQLIDWVYWKYHIT